MTILQELIVPLNFDGSNFESGIESAISKGSMFGSFMGNIASTVVTGAFNLLGNGLEKVNSFLQSSVGEAASAQEAQAQLQAVLKSTGGIAGVTADQVNSLADRLSKLTKFEDDAIVEGQNMLLTFTSIGKEVFPRATETILDMSQALGQDMKASAIQLGKALNDPIAGVTALRRVGVQFTDEQAEMIKKMVESGDLMKAQTFILDELQKEFGGSAEAAGKTFAGQLEILKNKLGNIKESIGNAVLPVLGELAGRFSNLIDSPQVQAMIDKFVGGLETAGNWIITNLPIWEEKFSTFAANLGSWYENDVKPIMDKLGEKLEVAIPFAIDFSKGSWKGLADFWITYVVPIGEQLARLWGNVSAILKLLGIDVDTNKTKWNFLFQILYPFIAQLQTWARGLEAIRLGLDLMNDILEAARAKWDRVTSAIRSMASALASLSLPFWLIPGSPTPLENGLRGIDNALGSLNAKSLPQFAGGLGMNNSSNSSSGSSFDYHLLARVLREELAKQYG